MTKIEEKKKEMTDAWDAWEILNDRQLAAWARYSKLTDQFIVMLKARSKEIK